MGSHEEIDDIFPIKITNFKDDSKSVELTILKSQAYSLLDIFRKESGSFGDVSKFASHGWIFGVETDKQKDDLILFLKKGIRSLEPTGSRDLVETGVDLVPYFIDKKPDHLYPKYLLQSDLNEFHTIWKQEFEARKLFAKYASQYGPYVSDDKINGQIQGMVFLYEKYDLATKEIHHRNIIGRGYKDGKPNLTAYTLPYAFESRKYPTNEEFYNRFIADLPERHRKLFDGSDSMTRNFCVVQNPAKRISSKISTFPTVDIYPFTGISLKDFARTFIQKVHSEKHNILQFVRSERTIDVIWYQNPMPFFLRIFFPWIKKNHTNIHKDVRGIFHEQIFVYGEHEQICNEIIEAGLKISDRVPSLFGSAHLGPDLNMGGILEGVNTINQFIVKVLKNYAYVIDGADLPESIRSTLKDYLLNASGSTFRQIEEKYSDTFNTKTVTYTINLQRNSSVNEVLVRTELDENCFALYMTKVYTSRRGHHSLVNGINVVDPTRDSPTYAANLVSGEAGIFVPSFDKDSVFVHDRTEYLSGLSKIVFLKLYGYGYMKYDDDKIYPLDKSYVKSIITYDSENVVGRSIEGWLSSGLKVKCRFSSRLMIDKGDIVGNIDSSDRITTKFYFTSYLSPFDMMRYMSDINYVGKEILKIRSYYIPMPIGIDNRVNIDFNNSAMVRYMSIRSDTKVYDGTNEKPDVNLTRYHITNNYPLSIKSHTDYYEDFMHNLTDCLVIRGTTLVDNDVILKDEQTIIYELHPIMHDKDDFVTFVETIVRMVDNKFDVIMYRRSDTYIDIIFDNNDELTTTKDIKFLRHCIGIEEEEISYDEDYEAKKSEPPLSITRTELNKILDTVNSMMSRQEHLHLPINEQKKVVYAVRNLIILLQRSEDENFLIRPEPENGEVVVRINFTESSTISEAFMHVQHAFSCIGWYNGVIVYNERYLEYARTSKFIIDPTFRWNNLFESKAALKYANVDMSAYHNPTVWFDMNIRESLNELMKMNLINSLDQYSDIRLDDNVVDGITIDTIKRDIYSGINPRNKTVRVILFTDNKMVTENTVTTTVSNMTDNSKELLIYRLDFDDFMLRDMKGFPDFVEYVTEYSRMSFLTKQEAILIMSTQFARENDDRMQLKCVTI